MRSKRNIERAEAIRRKRAELEKGGALTPAEEDDIKHQSRSGKASKWARGGHR